MKNKILFLVLFLICGSRSFGQLTLNTDTPSCSNLDTIRINASYTGYVPVSTGLDADDNFDDYVIPLGFTFSFYGTDYTSCIVGGNGVISFDTTDVGGFEDWDIVDAIPQTIPGNPNCYNQILGCYSDIYSPGGGSVSYATVGDAPNRKFVVTFCTVPMYGTFIGDCPGDDITFQMILYETSNNIEVHITTKNDCPAWNGGLAIQGVCNAAGTAGVATPGRNATEWTAYNDAVRFTPTSPTVTTGYTEAAIPYAPLAYAYSTIYWYSGGALVYTGPTLSVSPSVTTTYTAVAYGCNDSTATTITVPGVFSYDSSVGLFPPVITGITPSNPSVCGLNNDVITLEGVNPHYLDSFFYTINGVPQGFILDSAGADSTVAFYNLPVPGDSGVYSFYYATPGGCPSNTVVTSLYNPTLTATFTDAIHLGCNGDSVYLTNNSLPAGFNSSWNFGDGTAANTTASPVHVYADAATDTGTFVITLTYETVDSPACISTYTQSVTFNHPLAASFTISQDTVCLGVPITFTNTSVANSPSYLWNFGDGSTDISASPTHTFASGGIYNVVLTVTDTIPCESNATASVDIVSVDVHTGVHDTSVCLADSLQLHAFATVTGGIDSLAYLWTLSNNLSNPNDSVTNFFGTGDYTYLVTATTVPLGCFASDTETIQSYAPVTFTDVTDSQTIAYGSSIQLNADGAVYYTWAPDNGTLNNNNISDPIATPVDSITKYTVYGMNGFGCLDSATVTITLAYAAPVYMPTGFTPNRDGLNDEFKVGNLQLGRLVDFRIYDRWGQQVFQTANPEVGWDGTYNGTPQDIGTYSYMVIIARQDGVQQTITGTVTLIR